MPAPLSKIWNIICIYFDLSCFVSALTQIKKRLGREPKLVTALIQVQAGYPLALLAFAHVVIVTGNNKA